MRSSFPSFLSLKSRFPLLFLSVFFVTILSAFIFQNVLSSLLVSDAPYFSATTCSASVLKQTYGVLATNIQVNFQDAATTPPAGWVRDYGQAYGLRTSANQGSSNTYGWVKRSDRKPLDLTAYGRNRISTSNLLLATLMHMQYSGVTEGIWEVKVANGQYNVTVAAGDGDYLNSKHNINVEGVPAIVNFTPTASIRFRSATVLVSVSDGRLTVDAIGGNNTKINYIIIQPANSFKINFQDSATLPPAGWLRDFGQPYAQRTSPYQGSGYTFGWINRADNTPLDLSKNGRKRNVPTDPLLSTLIHIQGDDVANFTGTPVEGRWEMMVPNGIYMVTVSVGDGSYFNDKHSINVEGVVAILSHVGISSNPFASATVTVKVADGGLTIDAFGGSNTKINYITIQSSTTTRPLVVAVNPKNRADNISQNASISTSILHLPNGGINNQTITEASVFLTEEVSGALVPAHVNGTGGGDAITLVPSAPLKLNTSYVFRITDGVKDLSGTAFIPFTSAFTTTTVATTPMPNVKFNKVQLPNATGRHSSLSIGPDGKLYALSIDGVIKRFAINADGTLAPPELIYALQDAYGNRQSRLAIGLAFDPTATASNPVVWITHSSFVFLNGPDWDGKLTVLSGSGLQNVQDVLINLPRSAKDHLTNSLAFGPDGALYFTQGSNTAMGAADQTWSNRAEHLLSAAVLRLDKTKLGSSLPLNVKTSEGGGTYNPYTPGAPLTIYASGVRNAYDLLWHSNGELYVPTNGSAAGGNTPASVPGTLRPDGTTYSGPSVPALTNVQQTQSDYLFRIKQGGYYGHPNPVRGEFVLNGGNPGSTGDKAQVDGYPIGTQPDMNWRGFAFDFQANKSPNGVIEYKSNTFNGALKGKLMVVRYSQNDDIIVLTPGGISNDIVSFNEGSSVQGFTGFVDPLDLVEDVRNGNIYISEYGGEGKITLLKPSTTVAANITESFMDARINDRSTAYLKQNTPNPFSGSTIISYHVPLYALSAKLLISDMKGAVVKTITLRAGDGQVIINGQMLSAGTYIFSLYIDDQQVDSKRMIMSR